MEKPKWIMDGNYNRTMDRRMERCDTVIYLDFSTIACVLGVLKRIVTTYGTVRPDMADGCPERFNWEFLQWVIRYNKKHRERNYRLLETAEGKKIIVLHNRREVKKFLKNM